MEELPAEEILRVAKSHGAITVKVFGSWARGDARPDSDLDLLVTVGPGTSLLDVIAMQQDLEDLLAVPVEILTEPALHPLLRDSILAEAKALVAA
jgi:predicted nucleotidyltransferase